MGCIKWEVIIPKIQEYTVRGWLQYPDNRLINLGEILSTDSRFQLRKASNFSKNQWNVIIWLRLVLVL